VPAVFEEVEERVMVKPASTRAIEVPAVYEDVTGAETGARSLYHLEAGHGTSIQRINEKGEIFLSR